MKRGLPKRVTEKQREFANFEREQNLVFNQQEREAMEKIQIDAFKRELEARENIRLGYTDEQGNQIQGTQDFQAAQANLDRVFAQGQRVGYTDPETGEKVEGTQEFQQRMQLALQEEAERQRVGYTDPETGQWVGGTQDFQQRMQEQAATTGFSHASQLAQGADERQALRDIALDELRQEELRLGREFTTEEREAAQTYATAAAELIATARVEEREAAFGFQEQQRVGYVDPETGERVEGTQEFQTGEREARQTWEENRATNEEGLRKERENLEWDRTSKLESARSGIADATSAEGIAKAVEFAQDARDREKTLAALDVIERLAMNPQTAFALSNSGLLSALGAEFGLDLSFLSGGGGTQSALTDVSLPEAGEFARMPIDQQRAQLNQYSSLTGVSPEDIRLEILRRAQGGGLATGSDAYATRTTV